MLQKSTSACTCCIVTAVVSITVVLATVTTVVRIIMPPSTLKYQKQQAGFVLLLCLLSWMVVHTTQKHVKHKGNGREVGERGGRGRGAGRASICVKQHSTPGSPF